MKNFKIILILFLLSIVSFSSCNESKIETSKKKINWNLEEEKLVTIAIQDYVEGLYLADTTRIVKSVDSTLRKIGYWFNPDEKVYRDNLPMTYNQSINLSANWNKNANRATDKSPKEVEIYDVNTKTASAKLTAE